LKVIDELKARGAKVSYYDPWIPSFRYREEDHASIPGLDARTLALFDLVVVCTAHSNVDYGLVQQHASYICDAKNAMKDIVSRENIEVL
jgi:UDP-N-acetyl-D-glucosamine dehydrogenase